MFGLLGSVGGGESSEPRPDGIPAKSKGVRSYPASHAYSNTFSVSALPANTTQFSVKPQHKPLDGKAGVKFNVETVSPALKEDKQKQPISPDDLRSSRKKQAQEFYSLADGALYRPYMPTFDPIRIEAESAAPANLVSAGPDAFITTCLTAFARHLPLGLKPDHIWALISYAFAQHVDKNAETLRKNFVSHEGKKRLLVRVNHFVMSGGVKEMGTDSKLWERDVFPDFSAQIKAHIGARTHAAMVGEFSTTDQVSKAANEIVLMSAMKNYFSYGMSTMCGIPEISLLGTSEDWQSLRLRAESLGALMEPGFAKRWLKLLLPVLDEFVKSYNGQVNHSFWQSMVKLRNTGGGSGSYDFISGWVQLFYPYLGSGTENRQMRPWHEMYFTGPKLDDFPPISSSAPVDWEYYGVMHNLHFHAGFIGMVQNPQNGEVMPELGWYVSHDPPKDPVARLKDVRAEIKDLLAGQEETTTAVEGESTTCELRVLALRREEALLSKSNELIDQQKQIQKLQKERQKATPGTQESKRQLELIKRLQKEQSEGARELLSCDN